MYLTYCPMDMEKGYYKHTVRDGNWTTKQHVGVCLLTSIIKDHIAEVGSLGIKYMSLQYINFYSFSLVKHHKQQT